MFNKKNSEKMEEKKIALDGSQKQRFEVMVQSLQIASVRKYAFMHLNDKTVLMPENRLELLALLSTPSNYDGFEKEFNRILPPLLQHQDQDLKEMAESFQAAVEEKKLKKVI